MYISLLLSRYESWAKCDGIRAFNLFNINKGLYLHLLDRIHVDSHLVIMKLCHFKIASLPTSLNSLLPVYMRPSVPIITDLLLR